MSSAHGDDFQEFPPTSENDQPEVESETGPRAERPNFLTATRFVDFDLPPEILEGLDKAGFEYCTPIQAQAIPVAMSGLDIAGQAQTGTGKTTAFLVPLLNRLLTGKPLETGVPRALIVTPTRELALQIHQDALVLAGATNLRQVLVIGGMDYAEQAELLAAAPEIVICTPGRIIDYLRQGVFKTKGIEVAVVDEADRLLDMGFIKDLKYLLGKLPPFTQRQTMLFSATLDERVLELTYEFMNPPQYITAEPDKSTKVNIAQELYHVGRDEKLRLLLGLLRREEHRRVIIFANTKSGVEWLSKKLIMNGFQAEGITGDLPQPKRLKLMESFKDNRLQILVATDVASRGIHVDDVSHVYNYDLPQDAENYVHRIGRTARAGHAGKAVSFGCEDYVFHLEAIENLLGEKIPVFWADQEWFQEDQGGEVHLKDRRGGDRKRGGPRGGRDGREGRPESGSGRGTIYRGPAKSQRTGGIFGLAPRLKGQPEDDPRQTLTWMPDGSEPQVEAEFSEAAPAEAFDSPEKESRPERDRKRKRRRGRRGRDAAEATSETAPTTPAQAGPGAAEEEPAAPIAEAEFVLETLPEAATDSEITLESTENIDEKAQEIKKAPAKKPRRAPARKSRKETAALEPAAAEAAPPVTDAQPQAGIVSAEEPAAEKPARKSTRAKAAPKTKTGAGEETGGPPPKPRRPRKKAAEEDAPAPEIKTDDRAEAAEKKPRRSTRKTAGTPAEAKEEAADAPKPKKASRSPRKKAAEDQPASEPETSESEEAPKKAARTGKKTTRSSSAPAKRTTTKKASETE